MKALLKQEQAIPITVAFLRIISGLLFIEIGGMKLFGWFNLMPGGPVHIVSQLGLAGILEFFGGIGILFGLFTRPIAFILSGEMAVAYWQFHAPQSIWPIVNHGEPAILFCFIYLFLAAYGAGKWSIDSFLKNKKKIKPDLENNSNL